MTWVPRVDGTFLTDFPQQLVLQGSVADVPFVTGVSMTLHPTCWYSELVCARIAMTKERSLHLHLRISRKVINSIPLAQLTRFTLRNQNQLLDYVTDNYFPTAPSSDINTILQDYPADICQGSPFNTNDLNALTPEYKRLAAIQGDLIFQSARRFFLQQRSDKQKTWSFCRSSGITEFAKHDQVPI